MGAVATRSRSANVFAFAVLGSQLPAVDEVLQLFLVLIGVPVRLIAEHAPLLDEVLKRGSRVPCGGKAPPARSVAAQTRSARDRQGAAPGHGACPRRRGVPTAAQRPGRRCCTRRPAPAWSRGKGPRRNRRDESAAGWGRTRPLSARTRGRGTEPAAGARSG